MTEAVREMNLAEYVEKLPEGHRARAEYQTIQDALQWSEQFFMARDIMDSRISCAPSFQSPISQRVSQAKALMEKRDD